MVQGRYIELVRWLYKPANKHKPYWTILFFPIKYTSIIIHLLFSHTYIIYIYIYYHWICIILYVSFDMYHYIILMYHSICIILYVSFYMYHYIILMYHSICIYYHILSPHLYIYISNIYLATEALRRNRSDLLLEPRRASAVRDLWRWPKLPFWRLGPWGC